MKKNFNHCESIYWVFTQLCNDKCDHCYNLSGPKGERITEEECLSIIDNLPDKIDRLILSGGEPLAERKILYSILDKLKIKYKDKTQIMLQTNGDLLNEEILDTLIEKGVTRFDIASIDRYHKFAGKRKDEITKLFLSRNMSDEITEPLVVKNIYLKKDKVSFGFWGATEDMWLGGNWARGRALEKDVWKKDPSHNFCAILSGARGFLGGEEDIPQEVSIQLWKINPCCPGTKYPLGDARKEKVADVLERVSKSKIFHSLNKGDAWKMGESIGVTEKYAKERTYELKNVCLWCDEFFENHFDMNKLEPKNKNKIK
ncbi:radical SAM protein [Ignavibacterium sp.]|uniref:radical SAM protein n=1 Tax=Ignavibacterium sp. TaxID=2651167 RepID=UPI00307FA262